MLFSTAGAESWRGYDVTDAVTRPGATVAFDIRGNSTNVPLDAVTSAEV